MKNDNCIYTLDTYNDEKFMVYARVLCYINGVLKLRFAESCVMLIQKMNELINLFDNTYNGSNFILCVNRYLLNIILLNVSK